jgi:hypothetical protein
VTGAKGAIAGAICATGVAAAVVETLATSVGSALRTCKIMAAAAHAPIARLAGTS